MAVDPGTTGLLAALLLIAALAACGDNDVPATPVDAGQDAVSDSDLEPLEDATDASDADTGADSGADADATEDVEPDLPPEPPLTAAAATTRFANDFRVDIEGSGDAPLGAVTVSRNTATMEFDGQTYVGYVTQRQPWAEFELTLYQSIFVASDRLFVTWFYCEAGALTWVWYEGTDGTRLDSRRGSGTCQEAITRTTVDVSTPEVSFEVPTLLGGFRVEGADVQLTPRRRGSATLGGKPFDVYVFDIVDCSLDCGFRGWYELHALLRGQEADATLGHAIFYLLDEPREVQVSYGLTLPGFERIPDRSFDATWELTAP